jgi:hypothetical protein
VQYRRMGGVLPIGEGSSPDVPIRMLLMVIILLLAFAFLVPMCILKYLQLRVLPSGDYQLYCALYTVH